MWTAVTSNMTPCSLVGVYPRFRGPWFPHNQGNIRVDYSSDIWYWRQQEPLKRPYISIKLHGVISQNIVIFIATEVKLKYRFEGAIVLNLTSIKKGGDKEVQLLSFNEEEWSVSVFGRFYTQEKGPLLNRRLCGPTEPVSTFRERQISSCYTTCAWHILLQYKLQLGYEIWSFCHTSSEKNIQIWQQGSKWRTEKITKWGTSWLCSQRV